MANTTHTASCRNVLKYPGSKWRIADWIIQHLPEHHSYLEPYFGSGAVLFKKQPSKIETINDIDEDVVNLYRCIRTRANELAAVVCATPFSRQEYNSVYEAITDTNEIEKARRFLVRCWMSYGSKTRYKGGWRHDVQGRENAYTLSQWYRLPKWIVDCAERLKRVQIEYRPAVELMEQYNNERVLIYADPPYLLNTRTSGKQYTNEMTTQDHIQFLEAAKRHKGPMIISGYESDLYNDVLCDWSKESIYVQAELGVKRMETIWFNYCADRQLHF